MVTESESLREPDHIQSVQFFSWQALGLAKSYHFNPRPCRRLKHTEHIMFYLDVMGCTVNHVSWHLAWWLFSPLPTFFYQGKSLYHGQSYGIIYNIKKGRYPTKPLFWSSLVHHMALRQQEPYPKQQSHIISFFSKARD